MKITHIVFDKTGTLTYSKRGQIFFEGKILNEGEESWIASLLSNSTHPLSRRIFTSYFKKKYIHHTIRSYREIKGQGIYGDVEGHHIRIGSEDLLNRKINFPQFLTDIAESNHSKVYVSIDGNFKGVFFIENNYRQGLHSLISNLGKYFQLSILSGDRETEKEDLKSIFHDGTIMRFNQKPEEKLIYIQSIQKKGGQVMMLGDGLNDAGALVKSDIGIAVTEDITSFTPASDAILDAEKLSELDKFIFFSRSSKHIIMTSFIISFLYNLLGMGFALMGELTPIIAAILMPASSISVVLFASFAVNTMARIKNLV